MTGPVVTPHRGRETLARGFLAFVATVLAWPADAYASVTFYTANGDFFGGRGQIRRPLGAFQAHVSYTFRPGPWAALNATYYTGGATTVDGVREANRLANARVGATLAMPVAQRQSFQLHYSRGAFTGFGGDFETFGLAWRTFWF